MTRSPASIDRCPGTCYRPRRLRTLRCVPTVAVLAVAPLLGCGPVEYISQVGNRAASAVSAAKQAEADRYAPYEYTAAEEYLHKAREEAGYSQYQDSIEYGHKAEEMAQRARAIALDHMSQPSGARAPSSQTSSPPSSQTTKGGDKGSDGIEPPPPPPSPGKRAKARTKPA